MVDRFFHVFFGAGCVTLFFAPTIGAAGAKPREADDFSRCGEARQMSGHGAAGGMAEGKDFAAGKMLVRQAADLHGRPFSSGSWLHEFRRVTPLRDPHCRACGDRDFARLDADAPTAASLCGRDAVQIRGRQPRSLDLTALKGHLEKFGSVRGNDYLLRFAVERYELTIFPDGRAIVKGTGDPAVARGIYARYIGS